MPTVEIHFSERDTRQDCWSTTPGNSTLPVEQLVKRFICTGMLGCETEDGPGFPGETLDDFLVKKWGAQ